MYFVHNMHIFLLSRRVPAHGSCRWNVRYCLVVCMMKDTRSEGRRAGSADRGGLNGIDNIIRSCDQRSPRVVIWDIKSLGISSLWDIKVVGSLSRSGGGPTSRRGRHQRRLTQKLLRRRRPRRRRLERIPSSRKSRWRKRSSS